jgi:hypothetical protein
MHHQDIKDVTMHKWKLSGNCALPAQSASDSDIIQSSTQQNNPRPSCSLATSFAGRLLNVFSSGHQWLCVVHGSRPVNRPSADVQCSGSLIWKQTTLGLQNALHTKHHKVETCNECPRVTELQQKTSSINTALSTIGS